MVCLQIIMSEQQMERARNNLRSAESRLAQANKQRAQALAKPKAAEVGPRPALHASCCGIRRGV